MTENMRTTLIGAAAAIVAAFIGVIGTVQYQRLVDGPKEGVFSAALSFISERDIPQDVRGQIQEFPCTLNIRHIEGPSVQRISIHVDSEHPLSDLQIARDDENTSPHIASNGLALVSDIDELRKGSVIEYRFKSAASPELTKRVVVSQGRELEQPSVQKERPWYLQLNLVAALLAVLASVIGYVFGIRAHLRLAPIGPLADSSEDAPPIDLQQILTSRRYILVFNPTANRAKDITFSADGAIDAGRNNNENRWRLAGDVLEILAVDGSVYSRFRYNRGRDRFENTNDPDTQSIRDQVIIPRFVSHCRTS